MTDVWFLQVFESASPVDLIERFPNVLQFTSHISKLLVSEIKKRAAHLSTGK